MKLETKKAALELSVSTVVVIVIAVSMLILGLVLVKTIFSSAKYNIDTINEKVEGEINKLFSEDRKIVVYLANQEAKIKQGEVWGVAFGIKNLEAGTPTAGKFSYNVVVSDPDLKKKCGLASKDVENWITTGRSDSVNIVPGDAYLGIVRFNVPLGSPLCTIRFHLEVKKDGGAYDTAFFDITTKPK